MSSPSGANGSQPQPEQALQEALALHRAGKRDLAMQRYVSILERDPKNLDALFYIAMIAMQEGQFAEGFKVAQRGLDIGPPQARFYNLLGQTYLRRNQPKDALNSFERANLCEPDFPDAYGNRGNLLADLGRVDEALACFDQALAIRPDNPEDHCNRATVLTQMNRLDEALAGFDRAIALLPKFIEAHYNRADALRRLNRPEEALTSFDRAIELQPEFAEAHSSRGAVLRALNREDEAKASFARADEINEKLKAATAKN